MRCDVVPQRNVRERSINIDIKCSVRNCRHKVRFMKGGLAYITLATVDEGAEVPDGTQEDPETGELPDVGMDVIRAYQPLPHNDHPVSDDPGRGIPAGIKAMIDSMLKASAKLAASAMYHTLLTRPRPAPCCP